MLGQFLITFREVTEAALITAIILSYLNRSGRSGLTRYAWYGMALAIVASLSLGVSVWILYGVLSETSKMLFEATTAFVAVAVLSYMIYWMAIKGGKIRKETEKLVENIASRSTTIGLISLEFVVVFREGFETVLFLTPFLLNDATETLTGMIFGALAATLLAYSIFEVGMKINLKRFFYFTSVMLILLAGGLAGYGTHELLEYYRENDFKVGWIGELAYALPIPANNPFHHKGLIGSIFAVMFGYSISAEWARLIIHVLYLAIALPLVIWVYRKY